MARIALRQNKSSIFDTTANNGKPWGGVKMYLPIPDEEGEIKKTPVRKMLHVASNGAIKTLYSSYWGKNISATWVTGGGLTAFFRNEVDNGHAENWGDVIARLTADTSIPVVEKYETTLRSHEDVYVILRVINVDNNNKTELSFGENVSLAISGVNANNTEIRGVFFTHPTILNKIVEYTENNNFSHDQWLDSVFYPENWEAFHNWLAEHHDNMSGYGDKSETLSILNAQDWGYAAPGLNSNLWTIDGNKTDINGCYLLNIRVPVNNTGDMQKISLQFILSDFVDQVLDKPTTTLEFSVNQSTVPATITDLRNAFNENVGDLTFDNGMSYMVTTALTINDKFHLAKSDSYPLWTNVGETGVTCNKDTITIYGFKPNGEAHDVQSKLYDDYGINIVSVQDLCNQGSTYVTLDSILKDNRATTGDTDGTNTAIWENFIPAVACITMKFSTKYNNMDNERWETVEIGERNVYVYKDIDVLNSSTLFNNNVAPFESYQQVMEAFHLDNAPVPKEVWTYSITPRTTGALLVITDDTGAELHRVEHTVANQTITGKTNSSTIHYVMSCSGFKTEQSDLTSQHSTVTITLSAAEEMYQVRVSNNDTTDWNVTLKISNVDYNFTNINSGEFVAGDYIARKDYENIIGYVQNNGNVKYEGDVIITCKEEDGDIIGSSTTVNAEEGQFRLSDFYISKDVRYMEFNITGDNIKYTYTLLVTPSDSTVKINNVTQSPVSDGLYTYTTSAESINYEVSKNGYTTQNGTITKDTRTKTLSLDVEVEEEPTPTPYYLVTVRKPLANIGLDEPNAAIIITGDSSSNSEGKYAEGTRITVTVTAPDDYLVEYIGYPQENDTEMYEENLIDDYLKTTTVSFTLSGDTTLLYGIILEEDVVVDEPDEPVTWAWVNNDGSLNGEMSLNPIYPSDILTFEPIYFKIHNSRPDTKLFSSQAEIYLATMGPGNLETGDLLTVNGSPTSLSILPEGDIYIEIWRPNTATGTTTEVRIGEDPFYGTGDTYTMCQISYTEELEEVEVPEEGDAIEEDEAVDETVD